ncbi:hypothetical protein I3760_03G127100 [Carya illinoinensis]|nr:hypothetical protein I3760_03G127100 [Carya illinoinensis]
MLLVQCLRLQNQSPPALHWNRGSRATHYVKAQYCHKSSSRTSKSMLLLQILRQKTRREMTICYLTDLDAQICQKHNRKMCQNVNIPTGMMAKPHLILLELLPLGLA